MTTWSHHVVKLCFLSLINNNGFEMKEQLFLQSDNAASAVDPQNFNRFNRRDFVKFSVVGTLASWIPAQKVFATETSLPGFPTQVSVYKQGFRNWSGEIKVDQLWTANPQNTDELLLIVNWAAQHQFKVRPRGHMHNWSPLSIDRVFNSQVLMVDMTQNFTQVTIDNRTMPALVSAQAGISMQALLTAMEAKGLGITACPAPGDLTLGGVLAIDGHGTAVPARGESRPIGHSYGSISNLVLSLTAIVYDTSAKRYVLREFRRSDTDITALLTHLGRAFIVSAVLQAGPNQRLQCLSYTNVSIDEMFDPYGSKGPRTFASYLDSTGRVEAIWFPFTKYPWLKIWKVAPTQPAGSRQVSQPFNYPFSDNLPLVVSDLAKQIVNGMYQLTPMFGAAMLAASQAGLMATNSSNLWGWSKNLLLYIKPTTLRVTANGYVILTSRSNVQKVIGDFINFYQNRVAAYQKLGRYPANGPIEIRVTGLDSPDQVVMSGAQTPGLSAIKPVPAHPEWNVAVWFDILTFPGTPYAAQFYREIELWMVARYQGDSLLRPEWSKGWAYSNNGAWTDTTFIESTIPRNHAFGQSNSSQTVAGAKAVLNRLDPYHLFSSPLIERLFH